MEADSYLGEGTVANERTPKGITKVPRKASIIKRFDPLSSLKSNTGGNLCSFSMLKPKEKTQILQKNSDLSSLENAELDILEDVSPRTPGLPENLAKPLIPVKIYTEEEFCQITTAQEFFIQKKLSKKFYEYEADMIEYVQNRTKELTQLIAKSNRYNLLLSEVFTVLEEQSMRLKNYEIKLEALSAEKERLKTEIRTAKEDQNNAEDAFAEIHSRYETSKSMIKSYKENIELLNQNINHMQGDLDKHANQYKILELRTHDLVNKATIEAEKAKKMTENEIVCLTAQLKRDQIKMSNLEDEIVHARSTNDKLNILYKEFIAKLSA